MMPRRPRRRGCPRAPRAAAAPRRAGTDAGKAADVDEAKAAALRSAVAGSDVGLSPKEKQAAKQAAFAANGFCCQRCRVSPHVEGCGMELDKLHILTWQTGTQSHGVAVTSARMGRCTRKICPSITARSQDNQLPSKPMKGSIIKTQRHNPTAITFIIH